jgi:DNA-binding LytR/AlgR family response regulator
MKNMEEALASQKFLRIHKSYIVNLGKVDSVKNSVFKVRGHELVAGKSYRKAVAEILRQYYSV